MANGQSVLAGALVSDDTHVMVESLGRLGISVESLLGGTRLLVDGCGGVIPKAEANLFVDNSGTTVRFLTAALALSGGMYRLDGVERMRQRPIGPLVEALKKLGVSIVAESPGGCPPVEIKSVRALSRETEIAGDVSSQYLSGLLLGSPLAANGLEVSISGACVSWPYVEMTRCVMASFGVEVGLDSSKGGAQVAAGQTYRAAEYQVEPDASAASYFWAVAAICGGCVRVDGLNIDSLQGDIRFVEALKRMGCFVEYHDDAISVIGQARQGIDIDMTDFSDTAQTLAVVALFVQGSTRITGVAHNRVKETDRIGNLAIELRKLGAEVEEHSDGLTIHPPKQLQPACLETYSDHRMAMSFALAGLKQSGVEIADPGCVAKTFPNYFQVLAELIGQ